MKLDQKAQSCKLKNHVKITRVKRLKIFKYSQVIKVGKIEKF